MARRNQTSSVTSNSDWAEHDAALRRISERQVRELEAHRTWHDYARFAAGVGFAAVVAYFVI